MPWKMQIWILHWIWRLKKKEITFILVYYKICFCHFFYFAKMLARSTRIYSNIHSQYSIIWFHRHKGFVATDPCEWWSLVDLLILNILFIQIALKISVTFWIRSIDAVPLLIQLFNHEILHHVQSNRLIIFIGFFLSWKFSIQRIVSVPTKSP